MGSLQFPQKSTRMGEQVQDKETATFDLANSTKIIQHLRDAALPLAKDGQLFDSPEATKYFEDLLESLDKLNEENSKMSMQMASVISRNRELDNFAHILSHDLRAPLRHIVNMAQILENDPRNAFSGTSKPLLEKIRTASHNAANILSGIRELTKVKSGVIEKETVDCNEIMHSVIETHKIQLDQANADIQFDGLPKIHAAPSLILQLFDNLLRNALLHGAYPLAICVSAKPIEGGHEFCFVNNSDKKHMNGIPNFEPFQPGSNDSTGLGLYICKKIIDAHSGKIWVEATEKEFFVHFTIKENDDERN